MKNSRVAYHGENYIEQDGENDIEDMTMSE